MFNRKSHCLRMLILGAAATGLLWPNLPVFSQTTNVLANKKKVAAKPNTPARSTEPPRLLAVPDGATAAKASVQMDSELELAAAGDKSEVQKQLEALYKQDNREMPDLSVPTMQPLNQKDAQSQQQGATTAPPTARKSTQPNLLPAQTAGKPAQGYTQNQLRTQQAAPYPAQSAAQAPRNFGAAFDAQENQAQQQTQTAAPASSRPRPVVSLFKKITGTNKPATNPNPVPPDYANAKPATNNVAPTAPAVPMTAPAQLPPAYSAPIATNTAPAVPRTAPALPPLNNAVRPIQQPTLSTASLNSKQSTTSVQVISGANSAPLELATTPSIPPLLAQPIVMPTTTAQLPQLMDEPIAQSAPPVAAIPELKTAAPTAEVTVDFPNPFPEGSETEVDRKVIKTVPKKSLIAREVPNRLKDRIVNESPKVTVETPKLADEPVKIAPPEIAKPVEPVPPTTTVTAEPTIPALEAPGVESQPAKESSEPTLDAENESSSTEAPKADEDPFAVDAKDFVEPSIAPKEEGTPAAPAVEVPAVEAPAAEAPAAEVPADAPASAEGTEPPALAAPATESVKPAIETPLLTPPSSEATSIPSPIRNEDPHMEKMRRIRERFGMKGLKGFCPVTLHDERELVDARPDYYSTFRSQKFHFASPEARDKFEAEPSRYAPAAYGADVVALSRDKDVIEGTLDFAAWFKGRLYLFGTQANYDTFVAAPAKFATLAGIE